MPVPCINYLQWTLFHICFSKVPAFFPTTPPIDFSSSQVNENRNNCTCCYIVADYKGLSRNQSFPEQNSSYKKDEVLRRHSLPEGIAMSENQKEYKMSRLKHSLTDTEYFQVFHSEETLAHNTGTAYYSMQGSHPVSRKN